MKRRGRGLTALVLLLGCSDNPSPPLVLSKLPAGTPARAGNELVSQATVARIAERQGITPRAAVDLAVADALLAQGARDALAASVARGVERAAAARALLEQLRAAAAQAGAPTTAELREITEERWLELDRPVAARTTHAVILAKPERDAEAHALAERLAAALAPATSADQFIHLAQTFPAEGLQIRAEALPFVTADGRIFQRRDAGFVAPPRGAEGFDLNFARAAVALERPGQVSAVVKSAFGYHVIRLEERLPAVSAASAELPQLLGPEVLSRRAGRARRELLERLKQGAPPQLERAADELTSQVKVTR